MRNKSSTNRRQVFIKRAMKCVQQVHIKISSRVRVNWSKKGFSKNWLTNDKHVFSMCSTRGHQKVRKEFLNMCEMGAQQVCKKFATGL